MSVTLDHDTAVAELTVLAEALAADPRLWELISHALRVAAGLPVQRPEYDDDPVLALLKACLGLSRADKRRLNVQLATIIRREGNGT